MNGITAIASPGHQVIVRFSIVPPSDAASFDIGCIQRHEVSIQNPNRKYKNEKCSDIVRLSRRSVVKGGMTTLASRLLRPIDGLASANPPIFVNDISLLNRVRVNRIATPRTTADIQRLMSNWSGSISIGGGRYSMGGQIAEEDSLHFDMRGLNKVVDLDPKRKTVRVQTGMRWRDLQTIIDPHDLAVKIMQSYSNFTIGGALSVNAHGRYIGLGPIINSVRQIQIVLAGGVVMQASPAANAELFYGAIGGYGGLGVITEAELSLVPNARMERRIKRVRLAEYPTFFNDNVSARYDAIMHNTDIDPGDYEEATAITWFRTDKPVTVAQRLFPIGAAYTLEGAEVWALSELPDAHLLRRNFVDPIEYAHQQVVWRNHEASMDVASLGQIATDSSTFALQEYFIPVANFEPFARQMLHILRVNGVNALNVSVRHSPADPGSVLAWAREEVFSFVLYYKQRSSLQAQREVGNWTRQLIDASLSQRGTYYLPYQLHATQSQFDHAYPRAGRFFALKAKIDPHDQFRNKLWDRYYRTGRSMSSP